MLRRIWERIEPWLTRAGHFDLLFVKTGLGGLIVTGLAGIWVGALAWWHQAPGYQIVLAAMLAMGLILFITNQCLRLITAWKVPGSISRQEARRLDRIDPGGIRLGGSIAVVITMLASALIIVAGLYGTNTYTTWWNNVEDANLLILPRSVSLDFSEEHTPFGVVLNIVPVGNLKLYGMVHDDDFQYPQKILSSEEENYYFRRLDAGIPDPLRDGDEIFPHTPGRFMTIVDRRFTKEQWDDFIGGKFVIYTFFEVKYFVDGYPKASELCVIYQKIDFPSAHTCLSHNKWRWMEEAVSKK